VRAAKANPAETPVRDHPNSALSGLRNTLNVKMNTEAKLANTPQNAAARIPR
jgi:hypothetical protein